MGVSKKKSTLHIGVDIPAQWNHRSVPEADGKTGIDQLSDMLEKPTRDGQSVLV